MTLRAAKSAATKAEHSRVFGNMSAPRDIRIEYDGGVYVRRVWTSGRNFGWGRWETEY